LLCYSAATQAHVCGLVCMSVAKDAGFLCGNLCTHVLHAHAHADVVEPIERSSVCDCVCAHCKHVYDVQASQSDIMAIKRTEITCAR